MYIRYIYMIWKLKLAGDPLESQMLRGDLSGSSPLIEYEG